MTDNSKKIRVLHVTFEMTIGGTQQVIRQLVENMEPTIIESEIVCVDGQLGELGKILRENGFKIHILHRLDGFDISLVKQLRNLIKSYRYDIIHCHQYTPYVYGLLASLFLDSRVIFTEHGRFYPDYGTWKRKLLNPLFNLRTKKITAISQATKNALVQYENFPQRSIDVIYNGIADKSDTSIDVRQLKGQWHIPHKALVFGTISRLQPIKNQAMIIRAFKRVLALDSNVHCIIVGDGESRKALEQLSLELDLTERITFTGFQNAPCRFHLLIDIFLLPSFSEGTSMTLLEAMSFSTPSIVTRVGGNPEIIINEEQGMVIESDNEDELFNAMSRFLQYPELIKKIGTKARKRYEELFTVQVMVENFYGLYGSVIDNKTANVNKR